MADAAADYVALDEAFQQLKRAFEALEADHGRGEYTGPASEQFHAALNEMHRRMDVFRGSVETERRSRSTARPRM